MVSYDLVLSWMLILAAQEKPEAPWAMSYYTTAQEIVYASQTEYDAAELVALAYHETRFTPANTYQLSPHWGTPSAYLAHALLVLSHQLTPRHPLAWYACGENHRTPTPRCILLADLRTRLALALLASVPRH